MKTDGDNGTYEELYIFLQKIVLTSQNYNIIIFFKL